ncbi:group-specific protein [Rossellomorea oryzaecorticis]|uniref:Group-specific protein n=1 Tax=Rossellomorea oryzaecorticis TaxID=1396505 RepID=A0ABU9K904_9BACI
MNFYIASSFKNIDNVRYISEQLKAAGHNQTYDWTKHDRAASFDELKEIGQKEKEAVMKSDVVIVLLPAGKGSHIELGIALGLNKRIILHSPRGEVNDFSETSTFYHLAEVEKFLADKDELVNFILEKNPAPN